MIFDIDNWSIRMVKMMLIKECRLQRLQPGLLYGVSNLQSHGDGLNGRLSLRLRRMSPRYMLVSKRAVETNRPAVSSGRARRHGLWVAGEPRHTFTTLLS